MIAEILNIINPDKLNNIIVIIVLVAFAMHSLYVLYMEIVRWYVVENKLKTKEAELKRDLKIMRKYNRECKSDSEFLQKLMDDPNLEKYAWEYFRSLESNKQIKFSNNFRNFT